MLYGRVIVAIMLSFACGSLCQAAVINVPGDQPTIQAAVNAANPNDTIQVAAGTYNERILISNDLSGVTLTGAADAFGGTVGGPGITTITGGIEFLYAGTITGLTFRNLYVRRDATTYLIGPIIRAGSTAGPNNNFTLQDCCLDGQLQTDIGGFYAVSGQFGGNVVVDHVEFKSILKYYVFETSSGAPLPTVTSYAFTNNWVHECNGTVVLRGNPSDWTNHVDVHDNLFENLGGNASQQGEHWAGIEVNRADNVSFTRNTITNVNEGLYAEGEAVQVWDIGTMDMSCNSFTDCFQGIFIYTSTITSLVISRNNISGNTQYGLKNDTGTLVDARFNWWGAANGPGPVGPGSGDGVSIDVTFAPWLTLPLTPVTVNVELEDIVLAPVVRSIHFRSAATSGALLDLSIPMTFTNRLASTEICLPASCLSAKDNQHTLWSTIRVKNPAPGTYLANFTGPDKLLAGDANNDNADDVWDFGIFMSQLGTGGHPYAPPALDADFTDSGTVDKLDFYALYRHFLRAGDFPCPGTTPLPTPKTSITVFQLAPIVGGLTNARKADLNRDNRVDTTDVRLYYLSLLFRR